MFSSSASFAALSPKVTRPPIAPAAAVDKPFVASATFRAPAATDEAVAPILPSAAFDSFDAFSRSFRSFSVEMISLCNPWYSEEVLSTPEASICLRASLRVESLSFVSPTAFPRRSCFCLKRSMLPGSIFRSLLTSLSWPCVVFISLLTPSKAFVSFVVLPSISIVMPLILSAMALS